MEHDSNQSTGLAMPKQSVPNDDMNAPTQGISTQGDDPQQSDNRTNDLDQEWVNKAKDIVEKTKGDPFMQSRELSKVKAEYLKSRYNKHISLGEDHS
jgi:hypothetical protein